ncbi:MAG: hypothetical protein ACFFDH_02215, partial [Promethearchaeota archaeon]
LENIIYEGRIREIEETFINYVVDGGRTKRTEIESHILAYLLLHPKLTQAQIHQLSHEFYIKGSKRGISRGKISSYLNFLNTNFPILKRERILIDRQYTYVYSFDGSIGNIMIEGADLGINVIHQMINFFSQKLTDLTNLNRQERAKSKIYPTLLLRVKELVDFWKYYLNVFRNFSSDVKERKIEKNIYQEIEESSSKLTVNDIEKELVRIPCETFGFIIYNEEYTKILSYLTLRKKLTQGELHKLTGLSVGYISQALKFLIKVDLIEKVKIKGIRKPYYQVDSIPLFYLKRFRSWFNFFEKWKPELEEFIKEFKENKEELQNLNGYERIKILLEGYLQLIPMLEQFLKILDSEIKKFKESK